MIQVVINQKNGTNLTIGHFFSLVCDSNMHIHYYCYAAFLGLPKKMNTDLQNIHFVCCSNEVGCLELAEGFIQDLVKLESEGIVVYDCYQKTDVLLLAPVIAIIGDNYRASEIVSHMGNSANKFCRMCMVCIDNRQFTNNTGKCVLHTQCDKTATPHRVSTARTKKSSQSQIAQIQLAVGQQQTKQLQTKYGLYGHYNPLFQLSVDLYK